MKKGNRTWVPVSLNEDQLKRFDEEMVRRGFDKRSPFMKHILLLYYKLIDRGVIKNMDETAGEI